MIARLLRSLVIASLLAAAFLQVFGDGLAAAYAMYGWKWCDNDASLSLQTNAGNPDDSYSLATQPVYDAASGWSAVSSNFNFTQLPENWNADVWVFSYDWGPSTLGQASTYLWPATSCAQSSSVWFNEFYGWKPPSTSCAFDNRTWYHLYAVALQELGHSLGLEHSANPSAVMYGTLNACTDKFLNQDDIDGIRDIYDF